MDKQKIESRKQMLERFQRVVSGMTQEQVDACAWLMGGFRCCWTPVTLANEYQDIINKTEAD